MIPKNKFLKVALVILAILLLLMWLLSLQPVAAAVAGVINKPVETVAKFARSVLLIGLGLFLITSGVGAISVPVIGIPLIIVGLGLTWWGVTPFFSAPTQPNIIPPKS